MKTLQGLPAKLTRLPLFELARTVVRESVLPVFQVPRPTSHAPVMVSTIVYQVVSPFDITEEKLRYPTTEPPSVTAPVPVTTSSSLTRSARMYGRCRHLYPGLQGRRLHRERGDADSRADCTMTLPSVTSTAAGVWPEAADGPS